MRKQQFLCMTLISILLSSCSSVQQETLEAKPEVHTTKKVIKDEKIDKPQKDATLISNFDEVAPQIQSNSNVVLPLTIKKYDIERKTLEDELIAPEYVTHNIIAFQSYVSKEDASRASIGLIDRKTKKYTKIRQASDEKFMNSLTGYKNKLYWVEFDKSEKDENHWTIWEYNLSNKKTNKMKSGVSRKKTDPPILSMAQGKLCWLEYEVVGERTISKIISFDIEKNRESIISTEELDESDERDGIYFSSIKAVKEGYIVDVSIFDKRAKTKSYRISFYPINGKEPIHIIDRDRVIDFTVDGDWFVWTEEGSVFVASLKEGKVKYKFDSASSTLTNDTPIIKDNYLFYRYAVNQIFVVDLSTGKRKPITDNITMTSKLFRSDSAISFGVDDSENSPKTISMYVIE
ncbi:hypothetical protein E8L90_18875 [Brevibacillus antibioticus]|uniref:DUF5050 domain-containing protein n=1 Tax=Brevibacillus antibioticus TaxID=2570228 RepID=A0A4U2YBI2_9BACL|nr:hypothetical protein [Brevibacillus antibioticus]TKI57352.1 hypothetical protein E8L90_18875 [Brevibacillus antibioticus]